LVIGGVHSRTFNKADKTVGTSRIRTLLYEIIRKSSGSHMYKNTGIIQLNFAKIYIVLSNQYSRDLAVFPLLKTA